MRRAVRNVLLGAVAIGVAGLVVPLIDADAYRGAIQTALQRDLGRTVDLSTVRFQLFPQPGFTLTNVTIGEDPAIGAEPVAYVTTLHATPRLTTLLVGKLEFAAVDLDEASLNLTRVERPDHGAVLWNFEGLLQPSRIASFPTVHMHSGRVNFKFGDTKSLFYLLETDVDLWPPGSASDPWTMRVRGKPARTDRTARGFGSFLVRGEWHPKDRTTQLDIRLEKSELGDMLTLFNGHEAGIEGEISGNAHLAGPVTKVGLAGRVTIANLHGFSQAPPGGNAWPLVIGGTLDATGQVIDIAAQVAGNPSPVGLRYRVTEFLQRPRWAVTANLTHLPLSPLVGVARNMGWAIPADFKIDGTADGAVSYSVPEGAPRFDGALSLTNSTFDVTGAPSLKIANAGLTFAGSMLTLGPAAIVNPSNETATVEGSWDLGSRELQASLASEGMAIASLSRQVSVAGIPLLSLATSGNWSGKLNFASGPDQPGGWSGDVHLTDTVIPFEAFADPLHLTSADATIDGVDLSVRKMSLSMGAVEAQGEYHYDPEAARPHKFRIVLTQTSAAAVEKLLMPALRRGNFLTYAFNFGRVPEPDWLHGIRADGTIQTASLDVAGTEFTKVKTRVLWDGMEVRLTNLDAQFGAAAFAGSAAIHLALRQPAYEISGKVKGMPWKSGKIDAEGLLATSGTGLSLLEHMKVKGSFEGREIDLEPLDSYESVAGDFDWSWEGKDPRVNLTQLVMKSGPDVFQGSAETRDNGQMVLKLSDGTRHIQAAGALLRGEALKVTQ